MTSDGRLSPLRIGVFHATLPQPGRKPGGVEVFVDRLARRLVERGHLVTLLSCGPAPEGAPYRHLPIGPVRLARSRPWRLAAVPLLLHRANELPIDVLHLHGDDWFYFHRRVPTVRTFHGSALAERLNATSRRGRAQFAVVYPLERLAARQATASYGVGPDSSMLYRARGILPIGVEAPRDGAPASREDRPTLLFVGTWDGRKRGRWLARIFRDEVLPRMPGACLWMVSDRCEPGPGVTWWPAPSDEELAGLYRRAWVFCLPSTYEGLGIPYLEAMAHGTPVIATHNPGAQMVLAAGLSGRIVEDHDLAGAIIDLLSSERARAELGAAGRRRSDDFTWERVVAQHERAYLRAIAEWGRARKTASCGRQA